jgi:hypothetical protein
MFSPELRVTQISDDGPIPSFFIHFRDPVNTLTRNWNHVRSDDFYYTERIIAEANALIVQRAFTVESLNHMQNAQRAGKPIVYETDDLMLDLPPESGFKLSTQNASAIQQMPAAADLVTCSTVPLLTYFADSSIRKRCGDAAHRQGNQRTIKHYTDELREALLSVTPQSLRTQSMAAVS